MKRCLSLDWSAFWKLERMLRYKITPTELKTKRFKATCLSILLYGCEGCTLTKKFEDKLNNFTTSCYRIILGIKRMDFISNDEVLKRVKQDRYLLIQLIQQRQLQFLGHTPRKTDNELVDRYVLFHPKTWQT